MDMRVERALARASADLIGDADTTATLVFDDERRYIYANAAAVLLLATPVDDFLGRSSGFFGGGNAAVDPIWAAGLRDGVASGDHTITTPAGEREIGYRLMTNVEPGTHVAHLFARDDGGAARREITLEMASRGRYVCTQCSIHSPPGLRCPSCGGRLVPLT